VLSTISLVSERFSPAELKVALTPHIDTTETRLVVETRAGVYRGGLATELLVAYIGGGAVSLSALITGAFALMSAHRTKGREDESSDARIVIRGADGSSVECPANVTREELDHLVEQARLLSRPTIELP
jgi:hypothetical protein